MNANERRNKIWRTLCERKRATVEELATMFGVSIRTIYYDLDELCAKYPLEQIRGRYEGGVKIAEWYEPQISSFNPTQIELLHRLEIGLNEKDKKVMRSIIHKFD